MVVEIDELRTSIEGWAEDEGSKLEARRLAVQLVDEHLRRGTDVMLPQYLGRTAFITELEQTARAAGAEFVQVRLLADEPSVVARFESRRAAAAGVAHPEHEVGDVRAAVADAMNRLELIARERPAAVIVAADDDIEVTLARLAAALER